jgi:antitoxin YefM
MLILYYAINGISARGVWIAEKGQGGGRHAARGSIRLCDRSQEQTARSYSPVENQAAGRGITRDGVPAAVLLSMDQFEGLMETLEILSDPKTMRSLRRSVRQAEAGKWLPHESVFGREDM